MSNSIHDARLLFTNPDADSARMFFKNKRRACEEKVMSVRDAVGKYVEDGDYLASGGFGTNRIATAALHEIVRQKKRNLSFAGHTTTHDFQILAAGNLNGEQLLKRVDAAYIVGLEARGLSPHSRRIIESGTVEICEWSNYSLACRFQAAAKGVSFLPIRSMLGTDTFNHSVAKEILCPFTEKKYAAVPALYPDVSLIHVHESDRLGNCRITGITVADFEIASASKKLIITTEKIVPEEDIRSAPHFTIIPSLCVDAVCEVPYGAYPANMPGLYFSDEQHLREWLIAEKSEKEFEEFLQKHIYGVSSFGEYLDACGALKKMQRLRELEQINGK